MLAVALAAGLAGCTTSSGGTVDGPVTVYVSLPLTGPRAADGQDAADGARLALEQADGKAGEIEVQAKYLDDAKGSAWDPVAVGQNARAATGDSTAAAYIGELDSEPTRASVPITNDASLVQVSPSAGAVDLTRPAAGYPDTPDRYQPSGQATFARIVPADDVVARAAADWASELGAKGVAAVSDGTPFGDLMASEFTEDAEEFGVQVVPTAANPELSFQPVGFELKPSGGGTAHAVSAELDPSKLPGREFGPSFQERFKRAPGPYAAYGFEAMGLVLQAIGDAGTGSDQFRDAVRQDVLGASRQDTILGPYSITREGDSTVCMVQRYEASGSDRVPRDAPCPPR